VFTLLGFSHETFASADRFSFGPPQGTIPFFGYYYCRVMKKTKGLVSFEQNFYFGSTCIKTWVPLL